MNNRLYSNLGLARRAGKLVSGEERVLQAIRSGEARLVLIADDASDNTRKKFTDKCRSYGVELKTPGNREQLGRAIGEPQRVIMAITDTGFANLILKCLE